MTRRPPLPSVRDRFVHQGEREDRPSTCAALRPRGCARPRELDGRVRWRLRAIRPGQGLRASQAEPGHSVAVIREHVHQLPFLGSRSNQRHAADLGSSERRRELDQPFSIGFELFGGRHLFREQEAAGRDMALLVQRPPAERHRMHVHERQPRHRGGQAPTESDSDPSTDAQADAQADLEADAKTGPEAGPEAEPEPCARRLRERLRRLAGTERRTFACRRRRRRGAARTHRRRRRPLRPLPGVRPPGHRRSGAALRMAGDHHAGDSAVPGARSATQAGRGGALAGNVCVRDLGARSLADRFPGACRARRYCCTARCAAPATCSARARTEARGSAGRDQGA